jgi:hypothetical protein
MFIKNMITSIGQGLTAETIIIRTITPATKDLTTQDATTRVHDADAHVHERGAHAHERGALAAMIGLIEAIISQVLIALIVLTKVADTTASKAEEAVAGIIIIIKMITVGIGRESMTAKDTTDVLTKKTQDTHSRLKNTTIPTGKEILLNNLEKNRGSSIAALPATTLPVLSHLQSSLV